MKTLHKQTTDILQEKGYTHRCHSLDALSETIEKNSNIVNRKINFYKWTGLVLLTLIPLSSALLSVSVSLKSDNATGLEQLILSISLPLSLSLTVATILNSIFRPSERFRKACLLGIQVDAFKEEFLSDLQRMDNVDEHALLDLVDKKRKEFEKYQEELISMFMPMETGIQYGPHGAARGRHG